MACIAFTTNHGKSGQNCRPFWSTLVCKETRDLRPISIEKKVALQSRVDCIATFTVMTPVSRTDIIAFR